jgi:hypothetical protein
MLGPGMGAHHGLPLRIVAVRIGQAQYIHLHPRRHRRHHGVHVLRNARSGMQRDRGSQRVHILRGNDIAAQKIPRRIGAVRLEAFMNASVLMCPPHVIQRRAGIKQLDIQARRLPAGAAK